MSIETGIDWPRLLADARSSDSAARDALFNALEVRLKPVVQYSLRGWSDQSHREILATTMVVVLEKLDEIQDNPQFYALTVLRNKIGDALRTEKLNNSRFVTGSSRIDSGEEHGSDPIADLPDQSENFVARLEKTDLLRAISDSIKDMPVKCRTIFLGLLEHRTIQEIWSHQNSIEPALKRSAFDKRVFDCRKKLRGLLKDHLT